MNIRQRKAALKQAANENFDVCIIGGGATGAGCALDAVSRGLKTILIEQEDFGAATSSKSTKLIHGGVRYLEQAVKKLSLGQYRMVQKALLERATLLRLAPHITHPLQLLTPCRSWVEGIYYYVGLKLYDFISRRRFIGRSELLSRQKALERIPTLNAENLFTAVLYYDGQLDDQRYNMALVLSAQKLGANCFNHLQVTGFDKNENGEVEAVLVVDRLTAISYRICAKKVINATGPFADNVRLMANPALKPRIKVSRGVHILLPKHMMPSSTALLIPQTADGRLIFAIPYQKHLLVGTTDDAAEVQQQEFGPNAGEVNYLLNYVNAYLDVNATAADVLSGFGGLRPLIQSSDDATKDLVRDHEVEYDATSGLISILGGKWTTYRLMAKDTVDLVLRLEGRQQPCVTENLVLEGSKNFSHHTAIELQKLTGWDHEMVKHLVSKYGDAAFRIAAIAQQQPGLSERLEAGMPYTYAELKYVITHESAFTVKDVINRRWGTQLANWKQALQLVPIVGSWMTDWFQWTEAEQEQYIRQYQKELEALVQAIHF
jgi:glycerol-3-phosphate dehydrogenase